MSLGAWRLAEASPVERPVILEKSLLPRDFGAGGGKRRRQQKRNAKRRKRAANAARREVAASDPNPSSNVGMKEGAKDATHQLAL